MYDIARLRIGLANMPRPVLRRVDVRLSTRLDDLHLIFQAAMGWENNHPYRFRTSDSVVYGEIESNRRVEGLRPACKSTLADLCRGLNKNRTFEYIYDFRDKWVHRVKLQAVGESDSDQLYPRLLEVKRRCPPEDCGGPWGYARFLESLRVEGNGDNAKMSVQWVEEFNPELVDTAVLETRMQVLARHIQRKRDRMSRRNK